ILTDLRSGELHLDAIARLYPHLTQENSDTILGRVSGASKKDILALVANFEPPAPERDVVRPVGNSQAKGAPVSASIPVILPPSDRVRVSFTADDELIAIVDRLRGLLRHKYPLGRLEDLFKAAAKTLLDKIEGEKTKARLIRPSAAGSRRVPMSVRAAVWTRDGGRCSFVSEDGRRCESREALEFDHVRPWALGGRSDSVGNIRLLCRSHNLRLARRRFGARKTVV
ncbi:MAG: HNH endonuclease, partial [Elusimicrobia bacterium]|nr:HNH endonuclease [Elusimicrobiota bacterium]